MSATAQAVLASWSFPTWITAVNLVVALLYICGWNSLRDLIPGRFSASRLAAFLAGIGILEVALASPIDAFDPFLLTDHMLQHMLLMMIVPPLILLGDPIVPVLHGLPRWMTRRVVGPVLKWRAAQAVGRLLVRPRTALILFSLVMIGWHLPAPYELALGSPGWHEVEHASFLLSSILFWWPVIQPWPSRRHMNSWMLPVYLLLADFVNTALSAFLAFSGRVFYPSYLAMPRLAGISAPNDQVAAGAMMWVIGSFAFLIPAAIITVKLLSPPAPIQKRERRPARSESRSVSLALRVLALALPLAAIGYGLLAPDRIDIDGDVMRMQGVSGPVRISVFTSRDPIFTGELEVAALIQDAKSDEMILDDSVDVQLRPVGGAGDDAITASAEHERATIKLLEAAAIEVPRAGEWELRVTVRRRSEQSSISSRLQVSAAR
jgi:putative membrane protein